MKFFCMDVIYTNSLFLLTTRMYLIEIDDSFFFFGSQFEGPTIQALYF